MIKSRVYRTTGKEKGEELPFVTSLGSYPILYADTFGEIVCVDCVNDPNGLYRDDSARDPRDSIVHASVFYEGSAHCVDCGVVIESAYGDPDE